MSVIIDETNLLFFCCLTCSLSFFSSFRKVKVFSNRDVELDHISSRIKFLFTNFSIRVVNLRCDFFQIVGTVAMENRIQYYFFFNLDIVHLNETLSVTVGTP